MEILVPVDGSNCTKQMLAYLSTHDELFTKDNHYTVVHVTPKLSARVCAAFPVADIKAYYDKENEAVLRPVRTFFKKRGIEAEFHGVVGIAADVLVKMAEKKKFDLLLMGSHGRGSALNLVMGSVATKVVAGTKTPVLLIR